MTRPRWRRPEATDLPRWVERLSSHPSRLLGPARHMFALACLDGMGGEVTRVVEQDGRWALCIVHPGATLVPAGDPGLLAELGPPTRRWRLLIGDVAAALPLLADDVRPPGTRIHHQRFMLVDPDRVPSARVLPDPGLRRAEPADLEEVTGLAVQLHTDDQFGDRVTRAGRRGYRRRIESSIQGGLTWVCGPVGAPIAKLDHSVSSSRWGVQLAGIVVAPGWRGQGLGRALVAAAVRRVLDRDAGTGSGVGAAAPGPGPAVGAGPGPAAGPGAVQGPGGAGEVGDRSLGGGPERAVASGRPDLPGPVSLHVRAANTAAIRAYVAAGFVDTEEWRLAVRP